MRDALGPGTILGYCTNVHAGASLSAMRDNLERHALAVKARVSPDAPMGVGLWLARETAREILQAGSGELATWLAERGLCAFTLNGFPYRDFHQPVVKHDVYEPDWTSEERLRYTVDLARILAELLGASVEGSISTLPLGWRRSIAAKPGSVERAAENLLRLVDELARLELETGKRIHVDLEPEPGCYLDTGQDVVDLFHEQLLSRRAGDERTVLRHLGVCHDICHAAVMSEDQVGALERYRAAGIEVGKVQVSSALRLPFGELGPAERREALMQLGEFAEDRYLHQCRIVEPDGTVLFYDDLPLALARADGAALPGGEWRIHFHVPLFLEGFGRLATTNDAVDDLLKRPDLTGAVQHFEVETYAWNVLPDELKAADLADGIAKEIAWLCERKASLPTD